MWDCRINVVSSVGRGGIPRHREDKQATQHGGKKERKLSERNAGSFNQRRWTS